MVKFFSGNPIKLHLHKRDMSMHVGMIQPAIESQSYSADHFLRMNEQDIDPRVISLTLALVCITCTASRCFNLTKMAVTSTSSYALQPNPFMFVFITHSYLLCMVV